MLTAIDQLDLYKLLQKYQNINEQISIYLTDSKIISDARFGFTKTEQLQEEVSNVINEALNENKFVIGVTTDLTKAFDMVKYCLPLQKVRDIGIRGQLYNYMTCLKNSRMC